MHKEHWVLWQKSITKIPKYGAKGIAKECANKCAKECANKQAKNVQTSVQKSANNSAKECAKKCNKECKQKGKDTQGMHLPKKPSKNYQKYPKKFVVAYSMEGCSLGHRVVQGIGMGKNQNVEQQNGKNM